MDGYLLDIVGDSHANCSGGILYHLENGIRGMNHTAKIILAVKVLGENRIMIVVPSDQVEEVSRYVINYGYLTISSLPIMDYERFAKAQLGVEDSMLPERKPPAKIDPSKPLFFIQSKVEPLGKSQEELLDIWKQEAVGTLSMVYEGEVPLTVYKVLVSRMIVSFIQVDAPTVDGISFSPIMKLMGDQVQLQARGVKVIQ